MLELIGVDGLTQWDVGRQINVDKDVDMVHFSNRPYGYSKNVKVTDGIADVPDMFLTSCAPLRVWAYVGDFEKGYTKIEKIYEVKPKNRPEDYIYTPEEVKTWEKLQDEIGNLANLETKAKENLVAAINEVGSIQPDWNQNDDTQPDYVKNKPFYLEKTLFIELTKDDFTVNDQNGYIKYMYRSTPKLDWFTSAESIACEIEIVDTNGRRYTATQDSIDVRIERDTTDDDREYWYCYSGLFEIVSGVDLDYYDDEYYYKDEWGVLVNYSGIEFSEINIKIYRVDVKKIPEICLDAAIGQTAITVGGILDDSESEIMPSAIVPDLRIPISPSNTDEEIYCDRISRRLRISGDLLPYLGTLTYSFPYPMPTTAGASISFDISSEGDTLWDRVGYYSKWKYDRYLFFELKSNYSGGGQIRFLSRGNSVSDFNCAVAASTLGHLYTVVFEYTNSYKTLNVTIKCVAE